MVLEHTVLRPINKIHINLIPKISVQVVFGNWKFSMVFVEIGQ